MLLTTTSTIHGKEFQELGLVRGEIVQSKNFGRDFMAGLKSIVGGEITGYTEMVMEARQLATQRMIEQAQQMGADAIICVRYTTSSVMQEASEILAYGTAVKFL